MDRRRTKIIALNDQLRTTFSGGHVQTAPGIFDLDSRLRGRALCVMSRWNKFDRASEHDRGAFVFGGYTFEWQIEYRGRDGRGTSPDPADPDQTLRILTLTATDDMLVRRFRR
jgi:hypothetical protein